MIVFSNTSLTNFTKILENQKDNKIRFLDLEMPFKSHTSESVI